MAVDSTTTTTLTFSSVTKKHHDTLYISQRAANSIIASVAPYRISSEALQAINNFLDEFLYFLIDAAHSLDLVRIKTAISTVLPTSVGKSAVLEAELELKTYVESGNSDNTKERTIEITPFPLQKVFEQFRVKCQHYSTLGEREGGDDIENAVPDLYATSDGIHIAPSLAIYLTAVLEYIGENILFLVAKTSEKHKVEVAKAREVYTALSEDPQISPLFFRMDLKLQMEAQNGFKTISKYGITASGSSPYRTSSESTKSSRSGTPPNKQHCHNGSGDRKELLDEKSTGSSYGRISMELKSPRSIKSVGSSGEKESDMKSVSSLEESSEKMKSFEQLINGCQTMKVSLTPNRLITIEAHKRPPKLAPREAVPKKRTIQPNGLTSGPTSRPTSPESDESDDDLLPHKGRKQDKESLYDFLKNTSPDDYLGNKANFKNKSMSATRRVKSIDQLEPVPERTPTSPKYTPLIAAASSLPTSPLYPSGQYKNTSAASPGSPLHTNKFASGSNLNRSISKASSLSSYNGSKSVGNLGPRLSATKTTQRKHRAQDLMDFLATTPPSEKTSFSQADLPPPATNGGNKKEKKKLKKFLSRFRKASFSDDQSLYEQPLTRMSSVNSFGSSSTQSISAANSRTVKQNKQPRYVRIEIPQLPKTEEKQEPSIFDQVEIQGRHARQFSKTISLNSQRSGHSTPNKPTFNLNERKPAMTHTAVHDEGYEDTDDKHLTARSSQFSIMAQAGSGFNTPTQESHTNNGTSSDSLLYQKQQNTSSALKTPPPSPSRNISNSPRASSPQPSLSSSISATAIKLQQQQPIYNLPTSQQRDNSTQQTSHEDQAERIKILSAQSASFESGQFISKAKSIPHSPILISALPTKIKSAGIINNIENTNNHHNHETTSSINEDDDDTNINNNHKASQDVSPVTITVTPAAPSHLRKRVGRSPSIDEAVKIVDEEEEVEQVDEKETVVIEVDKEQEREEALVVEWLLGTGFGFKNNITYLDVVDIEDGGVTDEDEYVEAVDDDFIMDSMDHYRYSGTSINAL
ncbi:6892_t:CDS:2 [Ambispora gerdemannii]|uniref:6892_t:CDS:1 n=1 Tax=Ambispora gerdemannii TaxID=144530 RepID=A0A9N8V1Z9_9GLOM|nr:6892_t:CDS:2 [Ambispora gerdemannii]